MKYLYSFFFFFLIACGNNSKIKLIITNHRPEYIIALSDSIQNDEPILIEPNNSIDKNFSDENNDETLSDVVSSVRIFDLDNNDLVNLTENDLNGLRKEVDSGSWLLFFDADTAKYYLEVN